MYNEEQALRKVSNVKNKHIIITIMVISFILIIALSIGLYFYIDKQPLIKIPIVSLSTEEWTSDSITLTVEDDASKIKYYSFDGGVSFQEGNAYVVNNNGEIIVQVMDIKGNLSEKNAVYVTNIDRESPVMIFENVTTIQMGSNFSVRSGVQITDKDSGLSGSYTVTPNNVNTMVEGEYILTYSAFDKAGNFIEKNRTIVVKDIVGRTYYRYRKGVLQTTECEPYLCNCVTSSTAVETGTCPTGYSMNESKQCCQTCYKTCKNMIWGEWSEWQQKKVVADSTTEVETMIK